MLTRHCASCCRLLSKSSYSNTQWHKPIATSRCSYCIKSSSTQRSSTQRSSTQRSSTQRSSTQSNTNYVLHTARKNNSISAQCSNYNLENPFAEGGFRWVAKGKYTEGERCGEICVCKWFKRGEVYESTFYDFDIKAVSKTSEIVKDWNSRSYINKTIKVNIPGVWTFCDNGNDDPWEGTKVLVEPFIDNYRKFNSNSGWADDSTPWRKVMQALSHFSFHVSGGNFVLCDLQGGLYSDGAILTDPVILSRKKQFGVTDLGPKGISSFFSVHVCNEYCKSEWAKPSDMTRYYHPKKGSSMEAGTGARKHVPTSRTKIPMSSICE